MHHFPCRYAVRQTPTEFRSSTSILTRQQEIDLKNYVIHMSERGFRIKTTTIAELANQLKATWTPKLRITYAGPDASSVAIIYHCDHQII